MHSLKIQENKEKTVLFTDGEKLPGKPNYFKLLRWSTKGLISKATKIRVTLEWFQEGAARATSAEALKRFRARVNGE